MHEPTRMCVVCRTKTQKHKLTRYVLMKEDSVGKAHEGNTLVIDIRQKMEGRGVYLCHNPNCMEKFQKLKHKKFLGKKV